MTTENQALVPLPAPSVKPIRLWPLWLLVIILLVILIGLATFGGLQLQALQQNTEQQQQALDRVQNSEQGRTGSLQQIEGRLSKRIENVQQHYEVLNTLAQQQTRQIDHNAMTLAQVGGSSRTDWLMAEAEYLLRLANQRITMEHDPKGAEAILKAADSVLSETQDPGVFQVRKALAKEQLALASVNLTDRDGLYLQLEALINTTEKLDQRLLIKEVADSFKPTQTTKTEAPREQPAGRMETFWKESLQLFKQNLVIRRIDRPVEPLLAPEQTYYLKQNLRLMLEQAELALLKKNQPLYQKSLAKAQAWIGQYFLKQNPITETLLNKLKQLTKQNIDPELPDISESLRLLKARVGLMYQQHKIKE